MLRRTIALTLLATPALTAHFVVGPSQAVTLAEECTLPDAVLTRADLPAGVSVVACAAVGRRLSLGHGIGVEVPGPGQGVTVSVLGVDEATSAVMSVDVAPDGDIFYSTSPAVAALATGTEDPSPAPCDDTTFGLLGYKWYTPLQWWLNDEKKPSNLTAAETLDAVRSGGANITSGFNDCGQADDVTAQINYQGTTTVGVDMFTQDGIVFCDVSSQTNDMSTVSFAGMPSGYLGATCTWRTNRDPDVAEATETDIRLNLNKAWTVTPGWSGCDQQYDLEYVVTHERGHSFGLADISGDHTGLTMYDRGTPCSKAGRTLALGDLQGLNVYY